MNLKEILQAIKEKNSYMCEISNNDDVIKFKVSYTDEVDKLRLLMAYDKFNKINLITTKTEELTQKEIDDYAEGVKKFINILKSYITEIDYSYKSIGVDESMVEGFFIEDRFKTTDNEDIDAIIKTYCLNDVASMYGFIAAFSKSVINTHKQEVEEKIKKKQKNT